MLYRGTGLANKLSLKEADCYKITFNSEQRACSAMSISIMKWAVGYSRYFLLPSPHGPLDKQMHYVRFLVLLSLPVFFLSYSRLLLQVLNELLEIDLLKWKGISTQHRAPLPLKRQENTLYKINLTSLMPPFEKFFQDIQFIAVWACAKEIVKDNILELHALTLKNS